MWREVAWGVEAVGNRVSYLVEGFLANDCLSQA